ADAPRQGRESPLRLRRYVAGRLLGAGAEEIRLHLRRQVLAGARVGEVQAVFVDQHRLVPDPALPRLFRDVLVQSLAELARVWRVVEDFGLPLQLDAVHGSRHSDSYRGLTSTSDFRCQLYRPRRCVGSWSTEASTKPRLRNQCMVRVVNTNNRFNPAARARCSIRCSRRSPSPRPCTAGLTASAAISPMPSSGYGYSAAQPKITPSCSITVQWPISRSLRPRSRRTRGPSSSSGRSSAIRPPTSSGPASRSASSVSSTSIVPTPSCWNNSSSTLPSSPYGMMCARATPPSQAR